MIVYLDGEFLEESEAKINVSDRGLLMGDGVFVTIHVREAKPLFLRRHLKKLSQQAKFLFMAPPSITEGMVETLIEKNRAYNGVWRLKIYYTGGVDTAMRLPKGRFGHMIMILKPYDMLPPPTLKVGFFPKPVVALQAPLKSLSHIGRYMVMEYAKENGFDDCITLTETGTILETAFGNLFWVENDHLYTPDPTLPLHPGVTIGVVLEIAKELGLKTHFVKCPQIPKTASLYRSNAMGGILPIESVDKIPFPRNPPLEKSLQSEYEKKLTQEDVVVSSV